MSKLFLFLLITFLLESCTEKLFNPIKGGYYSPSFQTSQKDAIFIHGDINYMESKKSIKVRAIEACRIVSSMKQGGAFMILAKGAYITAYYSLAKSLVAAGDSVKRGQEIGELFCRDSVLSNSLEITVEKDGKYIRPKW